MSLLRFGLLFFVIGFALTFAMRGVYHAGYGKAEAEGKAALETLKREYSDANAKRWAEYADKERQARERLQEEQARADTLAETLLQTESALAAERRDFTRRIADATRNNTTAFGPEFVRLYNEALYGPGWSAGAGSQNKSGGAASAAHRAGTAPAPGGGILPEQPVTLADLLAHVRDYGAYCRNLSDRLGLWNELAQGW